GLVGKRAGGEIGASAGRCHLERDALPDVLARAGDERDPATQRTLHRTPLPPLGSLTSMPSGRPENSVRRSRNTMPPVAKRAESRRGRPPTYSRDQIVRDVADALLTDPEMPLTMSRMAAAVGSAPMSLYRHFTDREDLIAS